MRNDFPKILFSNSPPGISALKEAGKVSGDGRQPKITNYDLRIRTPREISALRLHRTRRDRGISVESASGDDRLNV